MWMEAYVQEILIREHIANAQRVAARHHLLRRTTARPKEALGRTMLQRVVLAGSLPRITRRIVRMAFP
jgi:hypothetical protein